MKKHAITVLLLLLSVIGLCAQKVVTSPKFGLMMSNNSVINKIVLTDSTTTLYMKTTYNPGWWIRIPKETYIQPNGGEKLFIKRTEGIPLNEQYYMPASGEVSYELVFPAVPKSTAFIDYGEANEGGSWFIYGIEIIPTNANVLLPKELYGNWFDKTTGSWEVGIYEKHIVYKNKLWNYALPKTKKSQKSLLITNNGLTKELFYKTGNAGTLFFGESAQTMKECDNNLAEAQKKKPADDKPYELPVFKIDSATYSGYIRNYTARTGMTTISVSVDDIITGIQSSYLTRIDENGYFSIKLPYYYPHMSYVRSSLYNGSVFLEPGKELFQLIDFSNDAVLFMGETAKINYEMARLIYMQSFNYDERRTKILDMSPAQYKSFCSDFEMKDLKALDSIAITNSLSAKTYQVMKMELPFSYASHKMEYNMYWDNAYREKNNIPREQIELTEKPEAIKADYYDFLKADLMNNPLAVLSSGFNSFVNRLNFLEISTPDKTKLSSTTQDIAYELEKNGYVLSVSTKQMIDKLNEIDALRNSEEEIQFVKKYNDIITDFNTKYKDTLQNIFNLNRKVDNVIIYRYFKDNKIKLTAVEKKMWRAINKHDKSILIQKANQFNNVFSDTIAKFYEVHKDFISDLSTRKWNLAKIDMLAKIFDCDKCLISDLIVSQSYCRKIVENLTPVSPQELIKIQQQIGNPFIADYIALCNNHTIAKLEANKRSSGSVANETPKTEADKIFEAIMSKYKGKVVYVDFWATWCGPCRGGIERIKPLKEELADKNVVFVYITNPSSPQTTWSNLIPDIKGEHYRVTQDEWNFLAAKFNINGIPHCVLVGKNGEVINPKVGYLENSQLKSILEKQMNQ